MASAWYYVKGKMSDFGQMMNDKIQDAQAQRRLVLVIVCIALLLDNMLYMVIVPIIPIYLDDIFNWNDFDGSDSTAVETLDDNLTYYYNMTYNYTITTTQAPPRVIDPYAYAEGGSAIGILFASKAIVQLFINPFSGALIDRIGYDRPLMIGLIIMFLSTMIFAFGKTYAILFFARSLQGVGSAFADTAGLAMIADRYRDDAERTKALGIAQAFISFGCLVAPPFGGTLFEFCGKVVPFIFLACVSLLDGMLLLFVMKPLRIQRSMIPKEERPKGTPIWRLLMDPYIAVAAGALAMSNVSLAFLEPTIAMWMKGTMDADEWQIGFVWLPPFLPYIGGVWLTIYLARTYPSYQWLICLVGLVIEGVCSLIIPFSQEFFVVLFPLMGLCLGVALVDTAILPTLGYLVDMRYVSVYGSVYAIADISYSFAYAIGPILAGQIVQAIGFKWLMFFICLLNVLYAPVLYFLKKMYTYKSFTNECDVLVSDPPHKDYNTYMQNGDLTHGIHQDIGYVNGENHLTLGNNKNSTGEIDYIEANDPETYSFYGKRPN